MARIAAKVELTDEERKELKSLGRGLTDKEAKPQMTAATAGKRRRRFAERRLEGIATNLVRARRDDDVADVTDAGRDAAGRWSLRSMSGAVGCGSSTPGRPSA